MSSGPRRRPAVVTLVAAAALVAALAGILWRSAEEPPPRPTEQIITLPPGATFATDPARFAVSPDGGRIAMTLRAAERVQIWIQGFTGLDARPLAGTDGATSWPAWSPDGQQVAFVSGGALRRVPVAAGGSMETICDLDADAVVDWGVDDTILVSAAGDGSGPIRRVAATSGATPQPISYPLPGERHERPAWVPGARLFVYFVRSDFAVRQGLWLAALDGGNALKLSPQATTGTVSGEFLVYSVDRQVVARRFDTSTATFSGMPVTLADRVRMDATSHRLVYSASVTGAVLVFQSDADGALHLLRDWSVLLQERHP